MGGALRGGKAGRRLPFRVVELLLSGHFYWIALHKGRTCVCCVRHDSDGVVSVKNNPLGA